MVSGTTLAIIVSLSTTTAW